MAGLDPEALTNQSATASNNMMSAQQGRMEMIARVWAQGGMRKLFRGVFKCIKAYQDFARVEQIDGEPQTVDPRQWEGLDDLDVNINTGLGTGNRDRAVIALNTTYQMQKELYQRLGPDNPIITMGKMVKTLQSMVEESAISSYPQNYFGDAEVNGQPWSPPPPQPPQPSPDTIASGQALVAVEQVKAKSAEDRASQANQLEREKVIAEIASKERIAMDKNYRDYDIELRKLDVAHANLIVDAAEVDAENIRSDMMKGKAN